MRRSASVLSHNPIINRGPPVGHLAHSPLRSPIRSSALLSKSPSQPLLGGMTLTPSRSHPVIKSIPGTPGNERRMLYTDPSTGQKMIKVTSPGGHTILKMEPYRDSHPPSPLGIRTTHSKIPLTTTLSGQPSPVRIVRNSTQPLGFSRPPVPSQLTISNISSNLEMPYAAKRMIEDATRDFANPMIEDFECDDCNFLTF